MFEIEEGVLRFNGQPIMYNCDLDQVDADYINVQLPMFELPYLFIRVPVSKPEMLLVASHLVSYYSENSYVVARRIVSENEEGEKFLLFMLDRKGA